LRSPDRRIGGSANRSDFSCCEGLAIAVSAA
jgi:hypothetical protein